MGDNFESGAVWDLYIDCVGGCISNGFGVSPVIHLPFEGTVAEQPAHIMKAFRVIANTISKQFASKDKNEDG